MLRPWQTVCVMGNLECINKVTNCVASKYMWDYKQEDIQVQPIVYFKTDFLSILVEKSSELKCIRCF